MGTLSHLMDEVDKLPQKCFIGGVWMRRRKEELKLLKSAFGARVKGKVKRGCRIRNGKREVLVRVFNGSTHDILIRRSEQGVLVTHNNALLHITTTEDVVQYIEALCPQLNRADA